MNYTYESAAGEACKRDFLLFVKQFYEEATHTKLVCEEYVKAICFHLQALADGKINKLLLNCPPGVSKSSIGSVLFPAFLLVQDQTTKILSASYTYELGLRDSGNQQSLMQSEKFKAYYPYINFSRNQQAKHRWELEPGGGRVVTARDSGTGWRSDLVLIDDASSIADARSETERKKVIWWYSQELASRLNDPVNGKQLIIGHRLHENDIFGFIQSVDTENKFCHLNLPFEFDPANAKPNSLGWTDWRKEKGELLTKRFGTNFAKEQRTKMGHGPFQSMFNQLPTDLQTGDVFQRQYFKYYHDAGERYQLGERFINKEDCYRILVCDPALSEGEGCYTAIQCWDISPELDHILVHNARKQVRPSGVAKFISEIYRCYEPDIAIVEDVAAFRFLTDQLRQEGLIIRGYRPKPHEDKELRAWKAQGRLQSGQLYWKETDVDFESALLSWPRGKDRDTIDCLSMVCIQSEKRSRYRNIEPAPKPKTAEEIREERIQARKDWEQRMWDSIIS
jgi:phage terminase large subunit-like protein